MTRGEPTRRDAAKRYQPVFTSLLPNRYSHGDGGRRQLVRTGRAPSRALFDARVIACTRAQDPLCALSFGIRRRVVCTPPPERHEPINPHLLSVSSTLRAPLRHHPFSNLVLFYVPGISMIFAWKQIYLACFSFSLTDSSFPVCSLLSPWGMLLAPTFSATPMCFYLEDVSHAEAILFRLHRLLTVAARSITAYKDRGEVLRPVSLSLFLPFYLCLSLSLYVCVCVCVLDEPNIRRGNRR